MALSTGQVNDAFNTALGRAPSGDELAKYTGDNTLDGTAGQSSLVSNLKSGGGSGLSAPTQPGDVNGFLKNYQDAISQAQETLSAPQQSPQDLIQSIKSQILPNQPAPQAPNLVDTYNSLITSQGVQALEGSLAALKTQENNINSQVEASTTDEQGKPVAMNVIAGRQTEEQRQAQVQLDTIARQKQAVTEELSTRYSAINTIMQFTQQDYDNSLKSYDEQYQQNVAVYSAFQSQEQAQVAEKQQAADTVLTATNDMANLEQQITQQQQQSASANLQIYTNMITSGNTSYADMTPDQKLQIQKLEVQSGLGVGFVESLTADNPNGKVIYAGANGAVLQQPDGSLKTVSYNVGGNTTTVKDQFENDKIQAPTMVAQDAQSGKNLKSLLQVYSPYMSANDIYTIYNQNSKFGPAKESPQQLAQLGIKTINNSTSSSQAFTNN